MAEVTLAEMVRNGTMSAEMAAVLWSAVDEGVSFLTVAIPRFAGKTTMSNAVLALRPPETPLTWISGSAAQMEQLNQERRGGYLAVAEFDQAPMPGYIWGEPVRRVFQTVAGGGYSLQGVLHASSVEAGIMEITRGNRVPEDQASVFKLVLYIERFGSGHHDFYRRLTDLYEVHAVEDGKPIGHTLYRWRQEDDSFEKLTDPHQWGRDREDLAMRAEVFRRLADSGRTSEEDVQTALNEYRASSL